MNVHKMLEGEWGHFVAFFFSLAAYKAKRIKQYSVASKLDLRSKANS